MTDQITTPAQMREAVEQAVLAEKMRMMSWCAKRQAVSRKAWERAARKALAGDMADLRNRIALIDAEPLDIVQSDAGDDALPVAEPEPLAVKIKPLVWHKSHMSGWNDDWHTVPTGYTIRCADENGWKWSTPLGAHGYERSPEAAKSAAEADHAARILSQIDAVPAAQVRAEALEEAAKLADAITERLWHEYKTERHFATDHIQGMSDGAGEVADAIRALMEKPE